MRELEISIMRIPIALTWSARKARVDQASISDNNFFEEWAKLDIEMSIHERGLICMQLAAMAPSVSDFEKSECCHCSSNSFLSH